jgi:uncharacterized iron-regulated membrane protein
MKLRTVIFWPHLIAGITAGVVILMMSITGVLLTYERQMIAWGDSSFRSVVPAAGARRLPVEALLARIGADRPELSITAVTVAAAPDAPVMLTAAAPAGQQGGQQPGAQGGQQIVYADAYTGTILGTAPPGMRRFMSETRAWHRWLSVEGEGRPLARAITGWSNLLFLFVVVSGFYLWFPRQWTRRHLRPVVAFKSGLRGKARDFNWHNTLGVWSAIPLFIVVLSAIPISFPWGNALVYRAVGEPVPGAGGGRDGGRAAARPTPDTSAAPQRQGGAGGDGGEPVGRGGPQPTALRLSGLDASLAAAQRQSGGWRTINLRLPGSPAAPVVLAVDRGAGGQPQLRSTITVDRRSGAVISNETFGDQTTGRRLRSLMRFAHTGEVLGVPGQTVAGVATAGAVVLVWTGFALSFRRLRAWLGRRRLVSTADVADAA